MSDMFSFLKKTFSLENIRTKNIYLTLLLLLVMIYVLYIVLKKEKVEGFSQQEPFIIKKNNDLYDEFYSDVYDDLMFDESRLNYEMGEITQVSQMKPKTSKVLVVGSGTGHHLDILKTMGISCSGLEKSKSMIERTHKRYPKAIVKYGDARNGHTYNSNTFTHILSLYFTIYYIDDKKTYFENCMNWLLPGGYMALHLVDRHNFNPIINSADPLIMLSPQKYAKKRITNSIVKFNDFEYKANFEFYPKKDISIFKEKFIDDATQNVRVNEHTLYMESQKEIIQMAKDAGFIMLGKIDMINCQYEYQYIYIMYKPE